MANGPKEIELMTTTTYNVRGMTCGHCAASVTTEVGTIPGVTEVAVDVPAGLVTITSDAQVSTGAVKAAVAEAGYEVVETGYEVVDSCCGTGTGAACSTPSTASAP
jgi:copper chaperone